MRISAQVPKRLKYGQVCQLLLPNQELAFHEFLPQAKAVARKSSSSDAEDKAVQALVRAIASFDPDVPKGDFNEHGSLRSWVFSKIGFAMKNLAAMCPRQQVRDAMLQFHREHGRWPDLDEVKKAADLGPRQVMNVWADVMDELCLPVQLQNGLDRLKQEWYGRYFDSPGCGFDPANVRRALSLLKPCDACLLILSEVCKFSEIEILELILSCRIDWERSCDPDVVHERLDQITQRLGLEVNCPWDLDLFNVQSRSVLAVRLFRARLRLRALLEG